MLDSSPSYIFSQRRRYDRPPVGTVNGAVECFAFPRTRLASREKKKKKTTQGDRESRAHLSGKAGTSHGFVKSSQHPFAAKKSLAFRFCWSTSERDTRAGERVGYVIVWQPTPRRNVSCSWDQDQNAALRIVRRTTAVNEIFCQEPRTAPLLVVEDAIQSNCILGLSNGNN